MMSATDEHMMLFSQGAIDALCNQAFKDGRRAGYDECHEQFYGVERVHERLCEVLGVGLDQSLLEAVEQICEELKSCHNALRTAVVRMEEQRKEIEHTKRYAQEMSDAYLPAQQKIKELNDQIARLIEACHD